MKNRLLVLFLWCLCTASAFAQTAPSRFALQATVTDTLGAKLNGVTVMLQTAKDSVLTNYGRTDEAGKFSLKGVRKGTYILKITYVGMMPLNQTISLDTEPNVDLGTIKLKPIAKELYEVVVKAARAPLTIRGDTVEYDTRAFKVPPGSSVEDLLRKLPGVIVDREGNIRAQGQEVKRVTVDGKQFFSDDPKTATKNLQAEAISKVQVFSDKTEKAKLTGVDDGTKEKTMNLELKEEFKKGGFGKITGGAGPASNLPARAEVRGSYNKFDKKQQLSLIGLANNTNQTGLSWADYQDFRGSNSFNWNDNADFGFSSGNYYIIGGGDDESFSIPITGGDRGRGLSDNVAGGANYNYDTKKTKVSSNYYFSQTKLRTESLGEVTNFIPSGDLNTITASNQTTKNSSHRFSFRLEKELDTLNTLVFSTSGRYNTSNALLLSNRDIRRILNTATTPTTSNTTVNSRTGQSFGLSNALIYRHKFMKKGRSFAASANYELSSSDGTLDLEARNAFFEATDINDQLRIISQLQSTNSNVSQYKASLLFVEPLSKKFFWESFYNFSLRYDEVDRNVLNTQSDTPTRNDSLSRYYTNTYLYNRLGTSLRYTNKGLNLGIGGAVQQFQINGQYASDQSLPILGRIDRTFTTFVPNMSVNFDLKNNKYMYGGYNVGVQTPTSRQLQPIVDNSNPLFITQGNPDLLPAITHRLNLGFNYFNPGSFTNFYGGVNYGYNINQIVYAQTIDTRTLITSTRPQNITGGYNFGYYSYLSFPLKKTKATLDLGGNLNFGQLITPINGVNNQTNTTNYNVNLKLSLTPVDWFTFYGSTQVGINNARYSINTAQNAQTINNSYQADANVKLPGDIYVSTSFDYQLYRNQRFGFNQGIPLWNSAVYRLIGKAKRMEVRLSAYDMLNRNINVSQYAGQNSVSSERTRTLARYFMFSMTYNMRGIKASVRQTNGWD
ncbi:outer membrane beta-barrel family protein [Fibrivirga algicola]|uniref:Outer membrane beta-barrel protein n=1 Tax=Fibrivirga algicola TaxID=2950420 RepID=A0ABX0QFZ1_9BACT|nr:outer membrane beta-barrel family protein [Fibrivirga algicola]ARK12209.1 TonB-dependent receptor [Fibrella sp. ES10-3-2-2]NID10962.1 outer membrane beta-barrel protein [Fibrivirga algicola]